VVLASETVKSLAAARAMTALTARILERLAKKTSRSYS